MVMKSSKGRPESTNIEDHRPDDTFFQNLTPPFAPPRDAIAEEVAKGTPQAAMDDATGIINEMQTMQRMQERSWVQSKDLQDMADQKGTYITWKQDLIDKQYHNSNQFLLETFKRARSVGYPIHPLMPYLSGQLPSTAFEGQAGK